MNARLGTCKTGRPLINSSPIVGLGRTRAGATITITATITPTPTPRATNSVAPLRHQVDELEFDRALRRMGNGNHGRDAAADPELAVHGQLARCNRFDNVIGNLIGNRFVKRALIAVAPQIELERFEFDAQFIRRVFDNDRGKVRLSGYRTKARELRAVERNQKVAANARIGKRIKRSIRTGSHLCAV